jgi:thiamine-monophosphate kinase
MSAEFDLINWIRTQQQPAPWVVIPSGDDLAAMRWEAGNLLLIGVDQVLDGVHFDSAIHTAKQIGRKAMNRNLSDCAAMGCQPVAAVATVALPRGTNIEFAKELYLGMKQAGELFDAPIVGGDVGSWDGKLAVTLTILGSSAGHEPIRRSGARAGDVIYVTGPLGGSILGRHLSFTPRVREGLRIAASKRATAMIDISDGLSRDLAHICRESNVGAIVEASKIPIHADVAKLPPGRQSPLEHALHDGEDYELLFTASPGDFPECAEIGRIVAETGIFLDRAGERSPLQAKGWEHPF